MYQLLIPFFVPLLELCLISKIMSHRILHHYGVNHFLDLFTSIVFSFFIFENCQRIFFRIILHASHIARGNFTRGSGDGFLHRDFVAVVFAKTEVAHFVNFFRKHIFGRARICTMLEEFGSVSQGKEPHRSLFHQLQRLAFDAEHELFADTFTLRSVRDRQCAYFAER